MGYCNSVAIKLPVLFGEHGANRLIARFARERSILAALNHPNIARLCSAGVSPRIVSLSGDGYVPGVSTSLITATQAERRARCICFCKVLATAVQYAHGLTIIFRDIKPSNILR